MLRIILRELSVSGQAHGQGKRFRGKFMARHQGNYPTTRDWEMDPKSQSDQSTLAHFHLGHHAVRKDIYESCEVMTIHASFYFSRALTSKGSNTNTGKIATCGQSCIFRSTPISRRANWCKSSSSLTIRARDDRHLPPARGFKRIVYRSLLVRRISHKNSTTVYSNRTWRQAT